MIIFLLIVNICMYRRVLDILTLYCKHEICWLYNAKFTQILHNLVWIRNYFKTISNKKVCFWLSILSFIIYVTSHKHLVHLYSSFKSFYSVAHFKSYEWYWWWINVHVYIGSLVCIFELYQVKAKVEKSFKANGNKSHKFEAHAQSLKKYLRSLQFLVIC